MLWEVGAATEQRHSPWWFIHVDFHLFISGGVIKMHVAGSFCASKFDTLSQKNYRAWMLYVGGECV